jgi:hypothetical protein
MADKKFRKMFAVAKRERDQFDATNVCDFALINEMRSNAETLLRITRFAVGIDGTSGPISAPTASGMAKSALNGGWASPKSLEDDTNFVILESIRTAQDKKIYLTRTKHLDVIETYYPQLNRNSIPPKLGEWRGADLVTWKPNKPATIILGANGHEKLRELYPAARDKKDEITVALRTLDESYVFPEPDELSG